MPVYQFSDIQADVQNEVHGTISSADYLRIINRGVKATLNNVDFRSTKRKATLSPSLDAGQYDYAAPSDLKGWGVIDIRRQVNRAEDFQLVSEEEFDRTKTSTNPIFAYADSNFVRLIRISSGLTATKALLHNCESITANGTWAAGADASNLTLDSLQFVVGNNSINFDTASGAATAYVELTGASQVDLTGYELGDIFMWVYVPNTAIPTNFILRVGNDSSNYWSQTVTTNNEGVAFQSGWNLLRFSLASASQTGTVAMATIDYLRLTITKDTGDVAATDWRIDEFVARKGNIHSVVYYSKYLWQNSAGTYLQDATATTDYINVDAEEYEIIIEKCAEFAAGKLDNDKDELDGRVKYQEAVAAYQMRYPSEAKLLGTSYQEFGSTGYTDPTDI